MTGMEDSWRSGVHEGIPSTGKNMLFVIVALMLTSGVVGDDEEDTDTDYGERFALARQHYRSVYPQIQCGSPKPRVVRVSTASMMLVPPATVLHKCGKAAGCCESSLQKCAPKTKERVKLYFFVRATGAVRIRRHRKQKVKKFVFTNHTECHCVDTRRIPR